MIRKQILLTPELAEWLRKKSFEDRLSETEIVRLALESYSKHEGQDRYCPSCKKSTILKTCHFGCGKEVETKSATRLRYALNKADASLVKAGIDEISFNEFINEED